jgi:hypothetical protein
LVTFLGGSASLDGLRMGLIGSIGGASKLVKFLGVNPVGVGVHLVPLPVVKRGWPEEIGVFGTKFERGFGVWP